MLNWTYSGLGDTWQRGCQDALLKAEGVMRFPPPSVSWAEDEGIPSWEAEQPKGSTDPDIQGFSSQIALHRSPPLTTPTHPQTQADRQDSIKGKDPNEQKKELRGTEAMWEEEGSFGKQSQ